MRFIKSANGYEFYEFSADEQAQFGEIYIGVKAGELNVLEFLETEIVFKGVSLQEIDEFIAASEKFMLDRNKYLLDKARENFKYEKRGGEK